MVIVMRDILTADYADLRGCFSGSAGSFDHEVHEGHEEVLDLFVQLRALRALRGEYLGSSA